MRLTKQIKLDGFQTVAYDGVMAIRAFLIITIISTLTACATTPAGKPYRNTDQTPVISESTPVQRPEPVELIEQEPVLSAIALESTPSESEYYSDVWTRIRSNLVLDRHLENSAVKERIAWYARNQEYIDRVAQRATPYIYHILEALDKRNMPLDLALLPIVESAYQPFAYSRSHASGIWQFIPGTGKMYGLKQNWWYDGRRDITEATRGALDYLEKLNKQFNGDWQHALASYNSGEYNVERSIKRNKSANKDTDFFSLRLPRETRGYVPSLLAIAEIIANPDKYNITLVSIPDKPYFEKVDIGGQLDLSTAATLSGLSMDKLYTLNPGFNRWATDPDGPHSLLVPINKAQQFKTGLMAIPQEERMAWNQHVIKQGETLSDIAERYKTNVATIKETNKLRGNLIRTGRSLVIPTPKEPGKFYTLSQENRWLAGLKKEGSGNKYIYTIRRGDSLWIIGRRYNVSIKDLTSWNGINTRSVIRPGQKLTLWINSSDENDNTQTIAVAYTRSEEGHIEYTVKKGDSLWLISQKFGVTITQLQKWNNLQNRRYLQPGQKLLLQNAPALTTGA
jgi:membrane-bound lytic murein transglycosylase D